MKKVLFYLILAATTSLCAEEELQQPQDNAGVQNVEAQAEEQASTENASDTEGQTEEGLQQPAEDSASEELAYADDKPNHDERNFIDTEVQSYYENSNQVSKGNELVSNGNEQASCSYSQNVYSNEQYQYWDTSSFDYGDNTYDYAYDYGNDGCCEKPACSSIEVRGAFVYFKPTLDQSAYVISSTNNRFSDEVYPNGRRHILCPNYKPGFRLAALYDLTDVNTADLRFTYLDSHQSASTSGPFLFESIGYPGDGAQTPEDTTFAGTSSIRQNIKFYMGDATLNRLAIDSCSDKLSFIFGLQYIYVRFHQKFSSVGSFADDAAVIAVNNLLSQKSNFWGIGPEVGVTYDYYLLNSSCGKLAVNVAARGAVLSSSLNSNLHYNTSRTGPVGVNLTNDKLFRLNPTADAKIGLSYALSLAGIDATVGVGYEFIWVSQCTDKITSYDVAFAGNTLDGLDSLSLQGPYISLSIKF